MAFQLGAAPQGGQHADGDQAAGFQLDAFALPGGAPGVFGEEFLQGAGKTVQVGKGFINKSLAHHLRAGGQATLKIVLAHVCAPENPPSGAGAARAARQR